MGVAKGALNTCRPPHEVEMVSVPVVGRHDPLTVPVSVYNPCAQGPGTAVNVLAAQAGAV